MKILILDTYYPDFLKEFYRTYETSSLSYVRHKEKIMSQLFGTADFYSKNLRMLGHQAEDIILNDKILQKKWAGEHGSNRLFDWADGVHVPFTKIGFHSLWQEEILENQIMEYKPDVLYCQNLYEPGSVFLAGIKKRTGIRVVGQVGFPIKFDKEFFSVYDLLLSSFPHFVTIFRELGIKSEYFRIGFEASILPKLKKTKKQHPVTFVGGFSRHHLNTLELIQYVAEKAQVDFWGYGYENFPENSAIRKNYHGQAWGKDMYQILFNSGITLNRHGAVAQNFANNMRLYEATGVGSMLITDYKDNLNDLFLIGKEIEAYRSKEELVDKIKYYLSHKKERERIAAAGQKRTLRDHTYRKRMEELVKNLNKYL